MAKEGVCDRISEGYIDKPVTEGIPYQKQEKENKLIHLSLHPHIPISFLLKTGLCSPLLLIYHFDSLPKCKTRLSVLMFLKRFLSRALSHFQLSEKKKIVTSLSYYSVIVKQRKT